MAVPPSQRPTPLSTVLHSAFHSSSITPQRMAVTPPRRPSPHLPGHPRRVLRRRRRRQVHLLQEPAPPSGAQPPRRAEHHREGYILRGDVSRARERERGRREKMLNMNIQKYYCLKKSLMHLLSHFHRFCLSGPNDLLTREPQEFVGVLGDC